MLVEEHSGVTTVDSVSEDRMDPKVRERAYRALLRRDWPNDARRLVQDLLTEVERPPNIDWFQDYAKLTRSEFRIVELLCSGKSAKEIAVLTGCKDTTVRTHIQRIYGKARVNHLAGLMALILRGPTPFHIS